MYARWTVLLIALAVYTGGVYAIDPHAADDESAAYRVGTIDPVVMQVPEEIQSGLRTAPDLYLTRLVSFLVRDTSDDFTKIKRVHDWLTQNIAYDNDAFYGRSPHGNALKTFRATCGGYAETFHTMAGLAGIESVTIPGISRVTYDSKKQDMAGHSWNAVKIHGKWYIVDTTHDSRFSYSGGKFSERKAYRDRQLFISPAEKIIENFPNDPRQQFLEKPLSKQDFLSFPMVNRYWYVQYGIRFPADLNQVIRKERTAKDGGRFFQIEDSLYVKSNTLSLTFQTPPDVAVVARIRNEQGALFESHAMCHREESSAVCQFSAPDSGKYRASISARNIKKDKLFSKIYEFNLVGESNSGPELPESGKLYVLDSIAGGDLKILDHNFRGGTESEYFIELEYPRSLDLFSAIWDKNGQKLPSGTEATTLYQDEKITRKRYRYLPPRKGSYFIKIRVKPAKEPRYNSTAAIVRLDRGN